MTIQKTHTQTVDAPNERRIDVTRRILRERRQQHKKWGQQNHLDPMWCAILLEQVGEAAQQVVDNELDPTNASTEQLQTGLVQAAAVIVAWLEHLAERSEEGL